MGVSAVAAVKRGEKLVIKRPPRKLGPRPDGKVRINKKMVREALRKSGGFVSYAARALKCDPSNVHKWMDRHPDLKSLHREIKDSHLDMAEVSLLKQVKKENTAATIFMLKCLGKDRGFVEQPNLNLHAHMDAGSGNWVDIMKRAISRGTFDTAGRVIDCTPIPPSEVKRLKSGKKAS